MKSISIYYYWLMCVKSDWKELCSKMTIDYINDIDDSNV